MAKKGKEEGGSELRKPKTKQRAEPRTKAKSLNNQTLTEISEIGASSNS